MVKVNNSVNSSTFKITSGVPQGSVLGSMWFILYINDMPLCIKSANCRLYADDTLLGMDISGGVQDALQFIVTQL